MFPPWRSQLIIINQAHRFELKPNNAQRTLFAKCAGVTRFAWNWALYERQRLYLEKQGDERFTNAIEQHRRLNVLKKTDFPWMYEVSKCIPQEALRNLDSAYILYRKARKAGRKARLPNFKKKGRGRDAFAFTAGAIRAEGTHVVLPRIGHVRVKEPAIFDGRILRATVSRDTNRWFVSFTVELNAPNPQSPSGPAVGVDLGVYHMVTLSDGHVFENPKPLHSHLQKLRRLAKELHRRHEGSNNRKKSADRLAKVYWRIGNVRRDALHKATTKLAKNHGEIVIEDLNVRGMGKDRRLARAISDVGMGEFRRQLEYKCRCYGSHLTVAPRFYPSTKRCSLCGHIRKEMPLSERTYKCKNCGLVLDRDLNAALNLVAVSSTETLNACGDLTSTAPARAPRVGSMKLEVNTAILHGMDG
ncbi:MAG: RNA-guided endonuclease TnpB family protein [Thermoplasmatota archaeon]